MLTLVGRFAGEALGTQIGGSALCAARGKLFGARMADEAVKPAIGHRGYEKEASILDWARQFGRFLGWLQVSRGRCGRFWIHSGTT
jgi:hypothetical protein